MPPSLTDVLRLPISVPSQMTKDLTSIAEAVAQLPQLLSGLDLQVRSAGRDVSTLRDLASTLDARIARLEATVESLAERVAHIDDGLDARIPDLHGFEELLGRVRRIDDGLDERIPNLHPLPDEVGRIEGDVSRIKRDVARVLELTPDPDEPGALEKVKEALTPGD